MFQTRILEKLSRALRIVQQKNQGNSVESRGMALGRLDEIKKLQVAIALKNASGVIPDYLAKASLADLEEEEATVLSEMPKKEVTGDIDSLLEFGKRFLTDLFYMWPGWLWKPKKDLLGFFFPNAFFTWECLDFELEDMPFWSN